MQYSRSAAVWQLLDLIVRREGVFAKMGKRGVGALYWGDHQRFFKSMLMAAKVPALAAATEQAVRDGYSVVIGLQSTGESNMDSERATKGARAPRRGARLVCRNVARPPRVLLQSLSWTRALWPRRRRDGSHLLGVQGPDVAHHRALHCQRAEQ